MKQAPATQRDPETLRLSVSPRRRMAILVGVMLGMLLSSLDQTIVGTALPRVIADLGGLQHYAWVATSYLLASTVTVPIWGKLSDMYGRRLFFMLGMAVFMAGSALSGLSQDMTQLILFRGVQGLGAGAMMPLVMAIIGDIFPPEQRAKWQGLIMGVFGFSTIVGPTAGGWITDSWGWRWVFYVNMPVGALALLTAGITLPGGGGKGEQRIDYMGAAALVAGTVPLLLALSWGGTEYSWLSPQIGGMLALALVMSVTFFLVERRAPQPIISPSLFKNDVFAISVLASFLASAGMFGAITYLPLFVQGVIGESAAASGAVLTPMMLGFMISSIGGGQIMARTGRYKKLAISGFAVAAIGTFLLSRMDASATTPLVMRNMVVTGLGMGVMMSLFTVVVQNAFSFDQLGQVTATLQFFRSIGGTIGVAVLGTVMSNRFQSALLETMPTSVASAVPADRLAALQNPQVLLAPQTAAEMQQSFAAMGPQGQALLEQLLHAIRASLSTAITDLFLVSAGAMALAFVVTLFLREIPLRSGRHHTAATLETIEDELADVAMGMAPNDLREIPAERAAAHR